MFRERNVINTYLDAYEIFMLNLLISAFPSPTHITDFPNRKAHYGAIVPMIVSQMRCTDKTPKVCSVHQVFEMV